MIEELFELTPAFSSVLVSAETIPCRTVAELALLLRCAVGQRAGVEPLTDETWPNHAYRSAIPAESAARRPDRPRRP